MPISSSILSEFRRRIKDVRHSSRAFGVAIVDPGVTTATAEVTMGHLIVNVQGGAAPSIDFDLSNPRYDTIGRLYQVVSRVQGYRATLDEDVNLDHPSNDIEGFGPLPIAGGGTVMPASASGSGVDLTHHLFSDSELEEILKIAIQRHNPSLTLSTLPPQEKTFVITLAHAEVCRIQGYDASKRKGLDQTVENLIALADSFEKQYKDDTTRLSRAIQSPREANSNTTDEGDVMLGKLFRRSGRTGFMDPLGNVIPPDAAVLQDPDEHDIEDDNIRVVWQRNKNWDFYSYELWMDTRPDVIRTREGGLIFAGVPINALISPDTDFGQRNAAKRMTTSTLVFRSFGSNSNASQSSFATFVEEFGQLIRSFSVGGLESQTTYYFRLYIVNINYVATSSNVVRGMTKPLRARFISQFFDPNNPLAPVGQFISVTTGPAGTVVTLQLDTTKGAFTTLHTLKFSEKPVVPTITNGGYTLTATVPAFQNIGPKDLAIVSPTGLVDVRNQGFLLTAP